MSPGLLILLGIFAAAPPQAGTMPYAMAPRPSTPDYVVRVPLPAARRAVPLPAILGPRDSRLPLIVIDAGHGGFDSGADAGGAAEKAQALDLALALRDRLAGQKRFRVVLTRETDIFLPLAERSAVARRMGADLFISIHGGDGPAGTRLYTMAERSSGAEAERLVRRENTVGQPAVTRAGQRKPVLAGLTRQQIVERSGVFARLIVREGKWSVRFAPGPVAAGPFDVLRPLAMPAVLISAPSDEGGAGSQAALADAISRAVRIYFNRLPPER
jgi:N-acetylmuramoyl-L-alanine amidase